MADPVYANSSSWMSMAIESDIGSVASVPTWWIPVQTPKITPSITEVIDEGFRGSMVKNYMQIPTVRHDEYTFTTYAYISTMPALFRSLLGSPDGITGTAAPYTHTIGLLNNDPTNANQPPSYTFFDYDGFRVRQLPAGQVDEIGIKFTATGLVELTVKVMAFPFTVRGSIPTPNFDTIQATAAWAGTPTIDNTVNTRLVDGELSLKRGVKPVHVLGQQGPYRLQVGPLEISGSLTVINTDDTELDYYLLDQLFPVSLLFQPYQNPTDTWTLQMSTCKSANASQERGEDELIVTSFDLMPLPNLTDAVAGGLSPFKFIGNSPQATSY